MISKKSYIHYLAKTMIGMILCVLLISSQAYAQTVDIYEYGGHYYTVVRTSLTWEVAKTRCESMGGHLATITSEEEMAFISDLINNLPRQNNILWIGGTDKVSEDNWKWITDEPFTYSNWSRYEPNNWENEDYLQISGDLTWNDAGESAKCYFICEWESKEETPQGVKYSIIGENSNVTISTSFQAYLETTGYDTTSKAKIFDKAERYDELLSNEKIANAIIWVIPNYDWTYPKWTLEQKVQLWDAILRIEAGELYSMQEPPQLSDDQYITEEYAWTIFISRVAHSLWLEANQIVSWSILEYTDNELKMLLSAVYMYASHPIEIYYIPDGAFARGRRFSFSSFFTGDVTDWNIDISYQFMEENGYILDDPASCVYAFAGWLRHNIGHITGGVTPDNCERVWGYRGPPPVDRILYPIKVRDGRVDSAGCWGTTGLFIAVMRSINIPATHRFVQFWVAGRTDQGGFHSALQLPTLDIGVTHSDDFNYQSVIATVPTEKIFVSIEWLEENIYNPVVLDQSDTYQNRPQDQAAYNEFRLRSGLQIEYLTDQYLKIRARDSSQKTKPTALIKALTVNSGYYSNEGEYYYEYAKPNYSEDELQQIVERLDNELIRIGNGDWSKGASIARSGRPIIIDLSADNPTYQLEPAVALLPWRSSNEAVVTISETGLVVGVGKGTATITAILPKDSMFKAPTGKVLVTSYAKHVEITGSDKVASGQKITLTAEVLPEETTNKAVSWSSTNTDIATVSSEGIVSAKKSDEIQTVTIIATTRDSSGVTAQKVITVVPSANNTIVLFDGVDCTDETLLIDLTSEITTAQLSAVVVPSEAKQEVTWRTSDKSIATVSEDGLVTGLKRGTVTITATAADGSKVKATCKVKVTNLAKEIIITGKDTLVAGKRTTLKAEVLPKQTANKKVIWTSSDTDIAAVNEEGSVTAKKIAETKTVTITATAQDGSGIVGEWIITVTPAE